MMLSFLCNSEKSRSNICLICSEIVLDIKTSPDTCKDIFHYKCLRNYIDKRIDNEEPIICPVEKCNKLFVRIANKCKYSEEILYQNAILSNDENTCCICFSKYKSPVASSDSCTHTFCCECINKWCTFKHECPMDRMPIKMLLISDFPGGHIINKVDPPAIEQDLNCEGDIDEIADTACEICNSGQNEHQLLLCDNCNKGYHIYCLPEPLNSIPDGDWYCDYCRSNSTFLQDNSVIVGRRLPRGLGRVITNLQERIAQTPLSNNRQRIRNSILTRTTPRPQRRRNQPVVETDSDLHSSFSSNNIMERTATRSRVRQPLVSRRIIERIANDIRRESLQNQPLRISRNNENNEAQPGPSRRRAVSGTRHLTRIRNNANINSNILSSDFESDIEPRKKKTKLLLHSSPSSEYKYARKKGLLDSSDEDEGSEADLIVTGSKKVNSRSTKVPRRLTDDDTEDDSDESSEEKEVEEDSSSVKYSHESSANDDDDDVEEDDKYSSTAKSSRKHRLNSDSDSDEEEFIPRLTNHIKRKLPSKKRRKTVKKTKKSKVVRKSMIKKRKYTISKTTRRYTRSKKYKRSKKAATGNVKSSVTRPSLFVSSPSKLSMFGRENHIPWVGVDESKVNAVKSPEVSRPCSISMHQSPNGVSTSLLTKINESQNNLRNMTLANIQRLSDGTVIHKPTVSQHAVTLSKSEASVTSPNKYIQSNLTLPASSPFLPNNGIVAQKRNTEYFPIFLSKNDISPLKGSSKNHVPLKKTDPVSYSIATIEQKHPTVNRTTPLQNESPSKESLNNLVVNQKNPTIHFSGTVHKNEHPPLKESLNNPIIEQKPVPFSVPLQKNDPPSTSNTIITLTQSSADLSVPVQTCDLSSNESSNNVLIKSKNRSVHFKIPSETKAEIPSTSKMDLCSIDEKSCVYTMKIENYIYRALRYFYNENKIDKSEFMALKKKILEKVVKKTVDREKTHEEKVRTFVVKYVTFYLSKKKK